MDADDKIDKTRSVATEGAIPAECVTCLNGSVNVATGQFFERRIDLAIPGTIPLRLERFYAAGSAGVLGRNWAGTWAQHLRLDEQTITLQNPGGSQIVFYAPNDRVLAGNLRVPYLEMIGRRSEVLKVYHAREQLFYVFDEPDRKTRRLSRIEDRNGNVIRFAYDSFGLSRITHSDGFSLDIDSEGGRILSARLKGADATDCTFSWTYNSKGLLTEARSAQTGYVAYSYDKKGRITGWRDASDTHVHYQYGSEGRIVKMWSDSGHDSATLVYDLENKRTVTRTYYGAVTVWDWTDQGLVWCETDPLGNIWCTEWDRNFHVTARIDPLGHKTSYSYDWLGNLTSLTDADGHTTSWIYGEQGLLHAVTDPAGHRTEYRRDDNGNVIWMSDALGRVTAFRLGEKGQIKRIELPGGAQERIYYDPLLRPNRWADPDGREVRMSYDTEGRLVWVSDALGALVHYDRTRGPENPLGAVCQLEAPNGAITRAGYDAGGRFASVFGPGGGGRHFRFGPFDDPFEAIDVEGHRVRLEHDRDRRISAMVNELGQRYEWDRDVAGQVTATRDWCGCITCYTRDAVGRIIEKVAPDGACTRYVYTPGGRLTESRVTDDRGETVTHFDYNASGQLTRAESADAVVEYERDALGHVLTEQLNGRKITWDYAVSGKRVARSGDVLPLTQSWSAGGLLMSVGIGDHTPLCFEYDARGSEQMRYSECGFALEQTYTFAGNLAEQIAGPLAQAPPEAQQNLLADHLHSTSVARTRMRVLRRYEWDAAGRLMSLSDQHRGAQHFHYDERNQISAVYHETPNGRLRVCEFEYDPARNIAAIIETDQGHQEIETIGGRVTRRGNHVCYYYDACGRMIEKHVQEPGAPPRIWQMSWNGRGQMIALKTPDGDVWHYRYDPLGRRILRFEENSQTGFASQWQGNQLIAEAPMNADGTVIWEAARHWVYEPRSRRPLAQVEGEHLYYIVTDHRGSPCEMLSEDGNEVVWRSAGGRRL